MKKIGFGLFLLSAMLVALSCGKGREETMKKYDTLFLGISLGMESKAFYDHCWEYNRKKVFTHGPANRDVEYKITTGVKSPVSMRFYPTFHDDKIFEMPVTFMYDAWAPWNRQYQSDSLFVDMIKVFTEWYGDFNVLDHATMGKVYYRMDGKRRINLFIKDDQFVQAVFTDLRVEKKLKEEFRKKMEEDGQQP